LLAHRLWFLSSPTVATIARNYGFSVVPDEVA
jgi:hypothetical protein